MELPVFFQAEQAALAALLGVLLAALYDLLRALRRVLPGAAGFADGLFALVFFLSMLAFALYPGQGVFRLGFFLEIALGAAAYFLTLSRLLLQIFEGILRAIRQILHTLLQPVRFGAKKFSVFLKKLAFSLLQSIRMPSCRPGTREPPGRRRRWRRYSWCHSRS